MGVCYKQRKPYQNYLRPIITAHLGNLKTMKLQFRIYPDIGISADDVAKPACYAYDLAAWRVRLHIKNDKGDIWTKAANYYSRTPKYNTLSS